MLLEPCFDPSFSLHHQFGGSLLLGANSKQAQVLLGYISFSVLFFSVVFILFWFCPKSNLVFRAMFRPQFCLASLVWIQNRMFQASIQQKCFVSFKMKQQKVVQFSQGYPIQYFHYSQPFHYNPTSKKFPTATTPTIQFHCSQFARRSHRKNPN